MKRTTLAAAAGALVLAAARLAAQCTGAPVFFPPVTYFPAGGTVTSIAHADLDGDGDEDIVVCNGAQIAVLRNFPPNGFLPQPPFVAPSSIISDMAVGDFDGDGRPDVAGIGTLFLTAPPSTLLQGRATVFLNQTQSPTASIGFAPPVVYPFGPQQPSGSVGRALKAADLDSDGILDLVLVDSNSTNVWIMRGQGFLGTGNGTFAPAVPYPVGASGHTDVAVGDFNQDGAPDLALSWFGGSVGPAFVTLLAGQLNGAGLPTGTFVSAGVVPTPGTSQLRAVEAVDMNADGYLDIVVANYNHVDVASGTGGFVFGVTPYPAGIYAIGLAIGDFTLDGVTDIAVARESMITTGPGNFSMLIGAPTGGYTGFTALQITQNDWLECITSADFDGDGRLDVAVGRMPGGVDVMRSACPSTSLVVNVTSPNGGEVVGPGPFLITWTKSASVALVDLDYSHDAGVTWEPIAASVSGLGYSWVAPPPGTSQALVRVRVSGLAVSDTSNAPFTIVGPGAASSSVIGSGCAPAGPVPALAISAPVLGGLTAVAITGAGGVRPAGIFVSPVPATPAAVGPGCLVYLDLSALSLMIEPTTDVAGNWTTSVSLPLASGLAGLSMRAQAAIVLPIPPGWALTNAVDLTFGF